MKLVQGLAICFLALFLSSPAFGDPKGELRYVSIGPIFQLMRFNVTESLISVDRNGRYVARLATSWKWLDERTIEFKLRRGVRFHNGEMFNARVVIINWKEYRETVQYLPPSVLIPRDSLVEAVDEYTVKFKFPEPDGLVLLKVLWFSQLAPESFKKSAWAPGYWGIFTRPGPWGTGPFMLSEGFASFSGQSEKVTLIANEHYWNKAEPRIKKIEFLTSQPNIYQALSSIMSKEGIVDFVDLRPTAGLKILGSEYATVIKGRYGSSMFGIFNFNKANGRWRQLILRQAINYAINRPILVAFGAKGNGLVTGGLIPPDLYGFNKDLSPWPFDLVEAKRLVAESGIEQDAVIRIIHSDYEDLLARVIEKMIEQTGLRVEREKLPYDDFLARISKWPLTSTRKGGQDWDIAILFMPNWNGHPLISWHLICCTTESFVRDRIIDDNLERLFALVKKTRDLETQEELIREIEKYVWQQAMVLFLYSPLHLWALNKNVRVPMDDNLWLYEKIRTYYVTEDHWSLRKRD